MPRSKRVKTTTSTKSLKITDFFKPKPADESSVEELDLDDFDLSDDELDTDDELIAPMQAVAIANPAKPSARFVGSMIAYVPGSMGEESDCEEYTPQEEVKFDKLKIGGFGAMPTAPYSTRKLNKHGKVNEDQVVGHLKPQYAQDVTYTANPDAISTVAQPLLDKMEETAMSPAAEFEVQEITSLSMCLNRMMSLSSRKNAILIKELSAETDSTIAHETFGVYWHAKWFDSNGKPVKLSVVKTFYKKLKAYDRDHDTNLAQQFREANESGIGIPYQELREHAKNHDKTKALVAAARAEDPEAPVYLHMVDSDVQSYNGVYSEYLEYIKTSGTIPVIMSTGYGVTDERAGDNPLVQAVMLDRMIRVATAKVFPAGVYYAEPNLCVLIPAGSATVPESIRGRGAYQQKAESAVWIEHLLKTRVSEDHPIMFIDAAPLLTAIPDRFRTNKRDGEHKFSAEFKAGGSPTMADFNTMKNISQTSLDLWQWVKTLNTNNGLELSAKVNARKLAGFIYKYLQTNSDDAKASLLAVMEQEQIDLIDRAYAAREAAILHYKQKFMNIPDDELLNEVIAEYDALEIDDDTYDIISGASITDMFKTGVLDLKELIEMRDATLNTLLYADNVIEALRARKVDFDDVVEVYEECIDGTDEDITDFDIEELVAAWNQDQDSFTSLAGNECPISIIIQVFQNDNEFIEAYVEHNAHNLDIDLDELEAAYEYDSGLLHAMLDDPKDLLEGLGASEFIAQYKNFQEQLEEDEREGGDIGDLTPYQMMVNKDIEDNFDWRDWSNEFESLSDAEGEDDEEYESLMYPSGEIADRADEYKSDDEDMYDDGSSSDGSEISMDSWYDDEEAQNIACSSPQESIHYFQDVDMEYTGSAPDTYDIF